MNIYNDIKRILPIFRLEGRYMSGEELHSGNINNTYHLVYEKDGTKLQYTLQRINGYVFKDADAVMRNIAKVTDHLRKSYEADGISPKRHVLELIPTKDGQDFCVDGNGDYWRVYVFIENATAHNFVRKPEHFYETGRAFGEFQRRLADFPAESLIETIPNFHDTRKRFYDFVKSVSEDRANHVRELEEEIAFFLDRHRMMGEIVKRLDSARLPLRVTHNDTKINNVMIDDDTDRAICVIDLDTVMPGSSLYDYGDAIRFGASTAVEDERDTSRIALDMEKFELFTRGFLEESKDLLTDEEIRLLPLGVKVITCELAMRFLMDYIDGDLYFHVRSPEHNLVRARAQMKLLTDIEKKEEDMYAIIEKLAAK